MLYLVQETTVVGDYFYLLMMVMKLNNLFPGFSKISFSEITFTPNFQTSYKLFSATFYVDIPHKKQEFQCFLSYLPLRIEDVINEKSSKSWSRIWKRKSSSNSVTVNWNIKKSVKYWVIGLVNAVNPLMQKSYKNYYEKKHATNSYKGRIKFRF